MDQSELNLGFEGSYSLLAGASLGVGCELAKLLLKGGAHVCIVGRDENKLAAARDKLIAISDKKKIKVISADAYQKVGREHIFNEVCHWCEGKLDHLVTFIGSGKTPPGYNHSIEQWKDVFDKNFFSVVDLVNFFIPILNRITGESSVTITSAIAGLERVGAPMTYSCAKAALSSFVPHLAAELSEHKIKVNAVNPGNIFFKGGRWEEIVNEQGIDKIKANVLSNVSLKRFGTPEEIAWAYLMLMTPKNSFTTGTNYVIDGHQVKKTI